MKTIRDFNLKDKKVLIRCDFNVPIKNNKIVDDTRIRKSLKTIQYAIDNQAKVILFSHLGRIKNKEDLKTNSLDIVATQLQKLLNRPVLFCDVSSGKKLEEMVNKLENQEVLLVENTRFEDLDGKKESTNNEALGTQWASLGDIFINDAFGTIHRSHASNVGIATHLPSGIGFLIEEELQALSYLDNPAHPYVVILGGGKVKDKVGVIEKLAQKADQLLIGGGMMYTFLKAAGYSIGASLLDEESLPFCKKMLEEYENKIILPIDTVVSTEFTENGSYDIRSINEIKDNEIGMDVGPETISIFQKILKEAKTVVWNGPLGVYEFAPYTKGTKMVLDTLTKIDAKTILGGGDMVAAATQLGYDKQVTHASTGGGATLEYLEGKTLPGLEVIKERS